MKEKVLRVDKAAWQRAKVCAAEADMTLKAYVERALAAASTRHENLKRTVTKTTPVKFLEEVTNGR